MKDDRPWVRRIISLPGFTIREIRVRGETTIPEHRHDLAYLTLVARGTIVDEAGESSYELNGGDVLFRPGGGVHRNVIGQRQSDGLIVEIDPPTAAEFCPLYENRPRSILMRAATVDGLPLRIVSEIRRSDAPSQIIVRALLIHLLALGARRTEEARERPTAIWLDDAERYITSHLDRRLSLDEIANAAGIAPLTLSRNFRARFGITLREFIRHRRVEAATAALIATSQPVAEIAHACGFYDQSQFARAFRAIAV